jgi:hypothetical protein
MARPTIWRVRVSRCIETFVDVSAVDASQAEAEAIKMPGVVSVFAKSALRIDQVATAEPAIGVRED